MSWLEVHEITQHPSSCLNASQLLSVGLIYNAKCGLLFHTGCLLERRKGGEEVNPFLLRISPRNSVKSSLQLSCAAKHHNVTPSNKESRENIHSLKTLS